MGVVKTTAYALFMVVLGVSGLWVPDEAAAMPAFARKYQLTCAACHTAYPRLNTFGEQFVAANMRLPNWKDTNMAPIGDELLQLPATLPLALRAQAFAQGREAEAVDVETGEVIADSGFDFQAPYLIKLLTSAPLSEHITFYAYAIVAEKGANGETLVEDAWFRHDDLFSIGTGLMLGQFQLSDLMFPREQRLTFQDFIAYRTAGITYDRGVLLDRSVGPFDLALGAVNGNGITENVAINSPGYRRPDRLFDNNSNKPVFGRIGVGLGPVNVGLFGLSAQQSNATGPAGTEQGARETDKRIVGLDLSGDVGGTVFWFAQGLWNRWDGFLERDREYDWFGGFAGIDYVRSERWVFSALYNYADADEFDGTDTIFEGIDVNSLSLGASHYFMRNVKGIVEANYDFLDEERQSGLFYTGHLSREHYVLLGIDAAY